MDGIEIVKQRLMTELEAPLTELAKKVTDSQSKRLSDLEARLTAHEVRLTNLEDAKTAPPAPVVPAPIHGEESPKPAK